MLRFGLIRSKKNRQIASLLRKAHDTFYRNDSVFINNIKTLNLALTALTVGFSSPKGISTLI